MLTFILLTCSTAAADPPSPDLEVRFIDQGPGKAPAVSPRPQGLPLALKAPKDARCVDANGSLLSGTVLQAPLNLYIARRDLALDLYPSAAQRKLDEAAADWAKRLDNAVADAKAAALVGSVDRQVAGATSTDVPLWGAVVLTLGGIAIGASVVAVFGW